ncbi:hypothetical protein COCSUDRAFT_60062 [Coccomyxa subellipsoidea C-169]|uniref:Uncharacterized protein n=1 Tax=Coccomyxa subellipsoidea (strain C-169) TaxID=574566 RepID=I0YK38_COCSC|nr:hypothetical protein COCSUDRAFT_60062 [Coccomyxa subellipsoidea C-169]EIE18757.1 hypothetical protein COCSUDRAFT_60062 [Coccomyxa subellipsoidea C-169]|eukprot:XP_005643301.1 hypothetical protein COCSUDRAFT_60062 [Coccomyxa subellipsoidea C-169]
MSGKDGKVQELVVTGRQAAQEIADEEASISGLYEQENASQLPCILNGAMAGLSGGALGYVFGFGGPAAALQNAVMLGLFSYVVDYLQMQSAEAASRTKPSTLIARKAVRRSQPKQMDAVSMLLSPSLPWLRPPCDACMACPLILPSALQQALPALRRRLQQ